MTIKAATSGPKAPKEPNGTNPQATAYARTKKAIKGCRLIGFLDSDTVLDPQPTRAGCRTAGSAGVFARVSNATPTEPQSST